MPQRGEPQPRLPDNFQPVPSHQQGSAFWNEILHGIDGFGMLVEAHRAPMQSNRLLVGATDGELMMTDSQSNVLVLGPPRSSGKTTGLLIPQVLTWRGPLVSISTKPDVFTATAFTRRRQGEVWSFSPDGSDPLPGTRQLRWSPISDDWDGCQGRAELMIKASNMQSGQGGGSDRQNERFWNSRAADVLAVLLFYAGLTKRPMKWVVNVADAFNVQRDLIPMFEDLNRWGHTTPADILHGLLHGNPRTIPDVFGSASVILKPYRRQGALATTEDPNFDMAKFVVGEPNEPNWFLVNGHPMNMYGLVSEVTNGYGTTIKLNWRKMEFQRGRYPTIYISIAEEKLAQCAPLVIGMLGDLQRQIYDQHRIDELQGTGQDRPPTLWAIDELASVPFPNLPALLRDSASQKLQLYTCLQDLGQTAKWGDEGKSLQTLFNVIAVCPGIRNIQTLEDLSKLVGNFQQEVWGGSYGGQHNTWQASVSHQRIPRLAPDDIFRGNPYDPDAALVFSGRGWQWTTLQFHWRTWPWPALHYDDVFNFLHGDPALWTEGLPFPQLVRNGDYSHLAAIAPNLPQHLYLHYQGYMENQAEWRATLARAHQEALAEDQERTLAAADTEPLNVVALRPKGAQ